MIRLLRTALPMASLTLALAAPGTATAEVLVACKNKTNGNLRVVADASACLKSELPLSWNATGLQGPAGPAGPPAGRPDRFASLRFASIARVSEPCSASIAAIFGKVAASDSLRESPAKTPVTMASTRTSAARRPMRRRGA